MTAGPAAAGSAGWLAGRVAVITGAGTGIGAAVTRRFAADGATVVLVGRRPQPLYDAAAQLGDRALVAVADATSATDMAEVTDVTQIGRASCRERV